MVLLYDYHVMLTLDNVKVTCGYEKRQSKNPAFVFLIIK